MYTKDKLSNNDVLIKNNNFKVLKYSLNHNICIIIINESLLLVLEKNLSLVSKLFDCF
jgi:hypothetical protein